jgi:outer membrane protein assembly factor BamB
MMQESLAAGVTAMQEKWHNVPLVSIACLVLLSACTSGGAQQSSSPRPPTPTTTDVPNSWIKTFEGPDYGAFFDVALTPDGKILAIGATNHLHFPPYSGDALIMKLTLDGSVLWERTWGGEGYEQAFSVVLAEDGGYYIFGETDSYGAGDRDFFLLKITEDGTEEWFETYGGAHREWPYGMFKLSNGELLIYGFTESVGGGRDEYAIRVTQDGEMVWEYTVENPWEELILDALETPEGDLVLVVSVEEDGKLVKLGADGSIQWAYRYELAGWQFASQVEQTDNGGFFLSGFLISSGSRQADTWLAGCTSTGEMEWETSFGEPAFDDYTHSMIRLRDGTYLLGAIGNGMLLSRVNEDGNVLWRRSLLDEQIVYGGMSLTELEDGGFLVAGLIQLVGGRSYDAILLRTDAEGRLE